MKIDLGRLGRRGGIKHTRRLLNITFRGKEGKLWRIIALGAIGLCIVLLLYKVLQVEPQLMATAEISAVEERGVLAVAVREDMPGFSEDMTGLEAELATLLAERLLPDVKNGDAVKLIEVTNMTTGVKIDDGTVDAAIALMPSNISSCKASGYSYSVPYFTDVCLLVFRKEADARAVDLSIGYIGVNPTYCEKSVSDALLTTYVNAVKETDPGHEPEMQKFASYPELFTALMTGKIDAACVQKAYADKYYREYGYYMSGLILGTVEYSVACSSDSSAITGIADILIAELRESGQLARMLEKYGLYEVEVRTETEN